MTRPKLILGVLAAACVGTLLWCARLIVSADLPRGASIAAWALWVVSAAAAVTLLAYLREFLAHRQAVGPEASWKPLPGLVLLWIGGATALVSFAFVLPDKAGAAGAERPEKASTSLSAETVDSTAGDAAATRTTTPASRSQTTRTPAPVSTTAPRPASTTAGATGTTSTSSTASATTTRKGPKGQGTGKPTKPTTSTTSEPPLVGITLPPMPR